MDTTIWQAVGDYPWENVPRDVRLIVSWKERPYEHLHLHTRVAVMSSFDLDWRCATSGEPITRPTHWQDYSTEGRS